MSVTPDNVIGAMRAMGCAGSIATESLHTAFSAVDAILNREGVTDKVAWWTNTLGQVGHESVLFSKLEENLYYRAERLMQVWPKHFKSLSAAAPYAGNPVALANRIYGPANPSIAASLGNTKEGDGWAFHGRGWPQLTGRSNYTAAGAYLLIDLLTTPEKAADPVVAWSITAWFMTRPRMLAAMRTGSVESVTRVINGGTLGLSERIILTGKARRYLSANVVTDVTPSSTPPSMPLLTMGDAGDYVKKLQDLLWKAGYPCGKIDGDFGINTYRAVKSFQASKGLVQDGKVGAKTWQALGV